MGRESKLEAERRSELGRMGVCFRRKRSFNSTLHVGVLVEFGMIDWLLVLK